MEEKKTEVTSPEKERLECQLKEVEIRKRLHELGTADDNSLDQLMAVLRAAIVDNDKSLPGSDISYKSVWDESELEEIKSLIMKKARKL